MIELRGPIIPILRRLQRIFNSGMAGREKRRLFGVRLNGRSRLDAAMICELLGSRNVARGEPSQALRLADILFYLPWDERYVMRRRDGATVTLSVSGGAWLDVALAEPDEPIRQRRVPLLAHVAMDILADGFAFPGFRIRDSAGGNGG